MSDSYISQLKNGAVGVIPTDTVYGIAASAFVPEAVERIFSLKGRDAAKPPVIVISSIDDLARFGIVLSDSEREFLSALWPAPVSFVLPCASPDFEYLHRGQKSLAFRVPAAKSLRDFAAASGPLATSSANTSGNPPAKTIAEARKYFGEKADFYQDGGELSAEPSTLVSFSEGKVKILRHGAGDAKLRALGYSGEL